MWNANYAIFLATNPGRGAISFRPSGGTRRRSAPTSKIRRSRTSSWIGCNRSSRPHKVPSLVPESFITAFGGSPSNPQLRWGLLAGMGCTFTALVLRGRAAHVLHLGDTRAYRLSRDRLACLTTDHVRESGNGRSGILYRALGVEAEVRLDYATQPTARHDRFLLCS